VEQHLEVNRTIGPISAYSPSQPNALAVSGGHAEGPTLGKRGQLLSVVPVSEEEPIQSRLEAGPLATPIAASHPPRQDLGARNVTWTPLSANRTKPPFGHCDAVLR